MKARFFGIAVSALPVDRLVVLFIHPGLNYGVDFRGGIQMEVMTSGPADLATVPRRPGRLGLGEITLQDFGDSITRARSRPAAGRRRGSADGGGRPS